MIAVVKLISRTAINFPGVFFHGKATAVLPILARLLPFFAEPLFRSLFFLYFSSFLFRFSISYFIFSFVYFLSELVMESSLKLSVRFYRCFALVHEMLTDSSSSIPYFSFKVQTIIMHSLNQLLLT